jgi:cytochrome c553
MNAVRTAAIALTCFVLGAVAERLYDHGLAWRAASSVATGTAGQHQEVDYKDEPLWAYGFETVRQPGEEAAPQNPPSRRLRPNEDPAEQTKPRTVAASKATYSLVDVRDSSNVVDWFPGDHPSPLPDIIAHGPASLGDRKWGCGSCHLPNGMGRPENAPPGGQPVAYLIRQLQDFRNGLRRSADPRKPNTNTMIALAKGMSEQEMREAAEYFNRIPYPARTRVVETALVPKTRIVANLFIATALELTEPIAGRIIEVPEDEEQTERVRNPRVGFVAYAPPGSLAAGKELVTTGGMRVVNDTIVQGKTTACVTCHGLDLMGVEQVPAIAGRSPSYIARQMWDIQQGTRNGEGVQLMKLAIARLTPDDLRAIAAYVASQPARRTEPVSEVAAR